jgi:hypothetical protein
MFSLFMMFLLGSLLLMLTALPTMLCLVPPNSWYGLCIGPALLSPGNWYEINMAAGWRMFKVGAATMVMAIGLYFAPGISVAAYYFSCTIMMVGLLFIGLYRTARHLQYYDAK